MNSNILVEVINYLDIKKVFIAIAIIYVINIIRNNAKKAAVAAKFMKIAEEKRKQRDAQIATEHISPDEVPEQTRVLILNSTVTQLTQLLNDDKITSEQILKTYHARAITLGHSMNLIGDSNYKEALELAKKCDEKRKNTRREDRHTLGGLFGIPVSIKDSFIQKGLDSTCGGAPMCFSPCEEDGAMLALLKSRGAIPFIRSNVPQTLGLLDCMNYIWGRGQNPWNKERTPGGSSGGEGGLIAARCSPIGLGSDALGSIRIPAAFNGVIGFKPTMGRYITKGHSKLGTYSASKMSASYFCNGPLSRTVDDAAVFVKELIREEGRKYDPLSPYVPWSEEKYQSKKKLRIAYTVSEDFFGACKASQRAVREAVEGLKRLGHETVEIKIPNFERMIMLMVMITSSEGKGRGLIDFLQGEAPIKELKGQFIVKALPVFIKKAVKNIFRLQGLNRFAYVVEMAEEMSVAEFHEKMNEYYELKDELLKFFTTNNYDAILTPAMPLPAFKHGHGMEIGLGSSYLWHANIANLVSGSVPVTVVKEGEDVYSPEDCIHHDRMFYHCQETIKGSAGLPLAVQVLTLPWEDEKCLAVMKAIESEVKFKGLPCP